MKTDIELLYKKHKTWIKIVKSFGCNNAIAEDIVQEMYVKIIIKVNDGLDIMYNKNEINYYFNSISPWILRKLGLILIRN